MRKKRPSIFAALLVLFLAVLACLVLVAALWVYRELPVIAEKNFGPASPALSLPDRLMMAARLYWLRDDLLQPVDALGAPVDFTVEMGDSVLEIANRLEREGLIRSADAFRYYLIYSGLDTSVQAGDYRISPALNALQIAHALQDATPTEVSFSILPGWRAEEIAAALPTSGLSVTTEDFLTLVSDPDAASLPASLSDIASLEGFLYPDVYRLKRDISAGELVAVFAQRFDEQVDADLRQALADRGYSVREAVILASIVQRESVAVEEQPMIASVFLNRMDAGMKLDSDPTVQYALGFNAEQQSWWTNPLSLDDLQIESPYNTYIYAGLPPGPISNPGLSAIRAIAYPAETPYFYFRARCDGSGRHSFARTFEEHQQNACP